MYNFLGHIGVSIIYKDTAVVRHSLINFSEVRVSTSVDHKQ